MRFDTARDVLLAYPQLGLGFQTQLPAVPSSSMLEQLLAEKRWPDAVAFVAHLLPRREAVWWAARCVRLEPKSYDAQEVHMIAAAESWVEDPTEVRRLHALTLGQAADATRPAGWVARAAGWAGGVLAETADNRVMCAPHMSPAAARGAILMASSSSSDPTTFLSNCLDAGMALLKRADSR